MRDQPRSASAEEGNQIDLTPMLDVVFIMLIFFIVTSSFVKEPGVELFKPQASTQESCERGTIIFAVDANGDIFYNKNKLPLDRALRTAEAAKKGSPTGKYCGAGRSRDSGLRRRGLDRCCAAHFDGAALHFHG
jgi:biopolymer transport protein ExbD